MEEGDFPVRRWEDLDNDILVKILLSFDLFELSAGLAHVCNIWRLACRDQLPWNTLDLSVLQSNFIRISRKTYVYVDSASQEKLTQVLNICLNLSRGNIQILIFHHNLYVNNNQLTFTAERCPRLKRLVMPSWNKIKSKQYVGLFIYGKILNHLRCLVLKNPAYFIEETGRSSKINSELKIIRPCIYVVCICTGIIYSKLETAECEVHGVI